MMADETNNRRSEILWVGNSAWFPSPVKRITLISPPKAIYHYRQHVVKNKTFIDHKTACRIFPHLPPLPRTRWDALEFE